MRISGGRDDVSEELLRHFGMPFRKQGEEIR
jgi:hypothetical protein